MEKTKTNLIQKKKAINYLLSTDNTQKHVTKKLFSKVGKKFNLTGKQVEVAYRNFLNFDVVDLRKKSFISVSTSNNDLIHRGQNTKEKIKKTYRFKMKNFTSKEFGNILHEFIFNYDGKITDFLIEKEINANQWYKIINDFAISGKILNRKILDFSKYKKLNVKALISFAHHMNKRNTYKYTLCKFSKYKDIYKNSVSLSQYTKAMHVLDIYL